MTGPAALLPKAPSVQKHHLYPNCLQASLCRQATNRHGLCCQPMQSMFPCGNMCWPSHCRRGHCQCLVLLCLQTAQRDLLQLRLGSWHVSNMTCRQLTPVMLWCWCQALSLTGRNRQGSTQTPSACMMTAPRVFGQHAVVHAALYQGHSIHNLLRADTVVWCTAG